MVNLETVRMQGEIQNMAEAFRIFLDTGKARLGVVTDDMIRNGRTILTSTVDSSLHRVDMKLKDEVSQLTLDVGDVRDTLASSRTNSLDWDIEVLRKSVSDLAKRERVAIAGLRDEICKVSAVPVVDTRVVADAPVGDAVSDTARAATAATITGSGGVVPKELLDPVK